MKHVEGARARLYRAAITITVVMAAGAALGAPWKWT